MLYAKTELGNLATAGRHNLSNLGLAADGKRIEKKQVII